jgi:hypothetical protein
MTGWTTAPDATAENGATEAKHYYPSCRVPHLFRVAYNGSGTWCLYTRTGNGRWLHRHSDVSQAACQAFGERLAANG